ncbi:MAG TPA: DUF418 domain-containing protein [Gemmatimonadaceae bacterium]|nr:DUF418 domain-containing protein [Gemmatimonadaceae bacterium]
MRESAPHSAPERIDVLDVLRGIALLGMYVVHFNYYTSGLGGDNPSGAVRLWERIISLFIENRFYPIFGMLFGVGFAVQLQRADARGEQFVARFLRRIAALAVFGFIAEGIFGYNVLFGYALWAVPLLLVRRWSVRALVVLVVVCAASRPISVVTRVAVLGPERAVAHMQARGAAFQQARVDLDKANESPSWSTVIAARLRFMPLFHRQWTTLPWGSFTLFLLGLIAFRLGLFDRPEAHRRLFAGLMAFGVVAWALSNWLFPIGPVPPAIPKDATVASTAAQLFRIHGFMLVRDQWLAFTYIGAVLLLVASSRAWIARLSAFAWTGRMALTNYMVQVILVDVLFEPHGFGLHVAPLMAPVYALLLFAAQSVFARYWLAHYRFGPLEWIWRSVTYWRVQPLRIDPIAPAPAVAPA